LHERYLCSVVFHTTSNDTYTHLWRQFVQDTYHSWAQNLTARTESCEALRWDSARLSTERELQYILAYPTARPIYTSLIGAFTSKAAVNKLAIKNIVLITPHSFSYYLPPSSLCAILIRSCTSFGRDGEKRQEESRFSLSLSVSYCTKYTTSCAKRCSTWLSLTIQPV
jgi:hypothetical protein